MICGLPSNRLINFSSSVSLNFFLEVCRWTPALGGPKVLVLTRISFGCSWNICEFSKTARISEANIGTFVWISRWKSSYVEVGWVVIGIEEGTASLLILFSTEIPVFCGVTPPSTSSSSSSGL